MPRGRDIKAEPLVRGLLIGESKTGKTHWITAAAEAGYHILYFNGDVAEQTIMRIDDKTNSPVFSDEAVGRITLINCGDDFDGTARFSPFLREFIDNRITFWDDTENKTRYSTKEVPETSTLFSITPALLNSNVIVVIDTWTTLVYSIFRDITGLDPNLDLGDMEKIDRSLYSSAANRCNDILHSLRSLPCHVVVLAHPDEQIRKSIVKGRALGAVRENELKIESTKWIPKSSSRAHGLTMGTYFSDVLWAMISPMGKHQISGKKSDDRICGSKFTEQKDAEEYSFARLVQLTGGTLPDKSLEETPGIKVFLPGALSKPDESTEKPAEAIGATNPTSAEPTKAKMNLKGLKL